MCGPAGLAFGTRCSIGGAAAELTESLSKPEDAMAKMAGHSRPRAPLTHLRASRLVAATREMQTLPRQERKRPQAWRAPSNAGTLPASTQLRNLVRVCTRRRRRNLRRASPGMTCWAARHLSCCWAALPSAGHSGTGVHWAYGQLGLRSCRKSIQTFREAPHDKNCLGARLLRVGRLSQH